MASAYIWKNGDFHFGEFSYSRAKGFGVRVTSRNDILPGVEGLKFNTIYVPVLAKKILEIFDCTGSTGHVAGSSIYVGE